MRRIRRHPPMAGIRGQASVEFVAVMPVLLFCVLVALQLGLAGWSLWSAGTASRAGARAEHVGRDGEEAARRALPGFLRGDAEFDPGPPLKAEVRVPSVVPGMPGFSVSAASSLEGGDG